MMNTLGVIASVIAAVFAIIAYCYNVRMSRGNIRRSIEKKQKQINEINSQLFRKFRTDSTYGRSMTSLDLKKEKLQHEIEELKKEL